MSAWKYHKESHANGALNCWYCDNVVPMPAPKFTAKFYKGYKNRRAIKSMLSPDERRSLREDRFEWWHEMWIQKEIAQNIAK